MSDDETVEERDDDSSEAHQPLDTIRRKVYVENREHENLGENEAIFTVNTDQLDRHGTVIDPSGGDFGNFRKNPVVLFDHGSGPLGGIPVGKVSEISRSEDRIQMRVAFDAEDPESERIMGKVKRGFLHAASIGFDPIDVDRSQEPTVIREWEMAELSIVPVPSNPGATVDQRSIDELNKHIQELPERVAEAIRGDGGQEEQEDRSEPETEPDTDPEPEISPETKRKIKRAKKLAFLRRLIPHIRTQVRRQLGKA